MSILRPACYKKFATIINDVYDRFENGSGQPKQDIDSQDQMERFLEDTIVKAFGSKHTGKLTRDTDLFAYGVDSLQATRIRNVITKSIELRGVTLGQNVVYEHPSVSQLARFLLDARGGVSGAKSDEQQHLVMLEMVDRWSNKLLQATQAMGAAVTPVAASPAGHVIVSQWRRTFRLAY